MTDKHFANHADAKKAGWFSTRHETPDANREARERYKMGHGPNMRKGRRRKK